MNRSSTSAECRKGRGATLTYVLVTPARNEAAFIGRTIEAVIGQTLRPVRWLIVSDGSTDGTDEIVEGYAAEHKWIELVRVPGRKERHFASKVAAFNAGYARMGDVGYDVIGNVDADVSFDEGYMDFLVGKFAANPRLGVAGTPFSPGQYDYRFTSIEHVSGGCQLFRRACFEEIGGYVPVKIGGIDLVAVLTARMKGWQTRSFPEKGFLHHRSMGTAKQSRVMVAFRGGRGDYMLGGHPVWEVLRCIYQMTRPPILLGGSFRLAGFLWAVVSGVEKVVSHDLVQFRRAEQMRRLRNFIRRMTLQRLFSSERI